MAMWSTFEDAATGAKPLRKGKKTNRIDKIQYIYIQYIYTIYIQYIYNIYIQYIYNSHQEI